MWSQRATIKSILTDAEAKHPLAKAISLGVAFLWMNMCTICPGLRIANSLVNKGHGGESVELRDSERPGFEVTSTTDVKLSLL